MNLSRYSTSLFFSLLLVMGSAFSLTPASALPSHSYFQGDYACTFTFKLSDAGENQRTHGLLVIHIKPDGELNASYLSKSTDINFQVKGRVEKDGNFEGRVTYEGRDWGTHKGTFTKLDNGTIKATLEERPNGRDNPWGQYTILGGPTIGIKR